MYKNFEDYLMEQYIIEENPLDDMVPDGFNDWMDNLDYEDWFLYAEKYALIKMKEITSKFSGVAMCDACEKIVPMEIMTHHSGDAAAPEGYFCEECVK